MFNGMNDLMKQAQNMQGKIQQIQEEIAKLEVHGESGAGLVKITINGIYNCRSITIDQSLLKDNDKEMLEDLIAAAFNDAARRITEIKKEKITSMSSSMQLPADFNIAF